MSSLYTFVNTRFIGIYNIPPTTSITKTEASRLNIELINACYVIINMTLIYN